MPIWGRWRHHAFHLPGVRPCGLCSDILYAKIQTRPDLPQNASILAAAKQCESTGLMMVDVMWSSEVEELRIVDKRSSWGAYIIK